MTDLSVFKDFSVRSKFVFKKLKDLLLSSLRNVAKQHCLDISHSHHQYARLQAKLGSSSTEPFAVKPRSGTFILPLAESVFSFKCAKTLLAPVDLEEGLCYSQLPVIQVNQDLTPTSGQVLFLAPMSRLLSNSTTTIPCSKHFIAKFQTMDGSYISQTIFGIKPVKPRSRALNG